MESLVHCVYASAARHAFTEDELMALLQKARANNEQLGLTGMLLYNDDSFFQVLEGEAGVVEAVFTKISRDKRHGKVTRIIFEPIAERSFGEWTMGLAAISARDVKNIAGLNDFFGPGSCFDQLDDGRAKKLLAAFSNGRWRLRIAGGQAKAVA